MIPENISRADVLAAINEIDSNGIPAKRLSRKYHLDYNGKLYPPKYVISLANIQANGRELLPTEFAGGDETNSFLSKRIFTIIPKVSP